MKTYSAKPGEVARNWYIVDAEDEILGRLASRIAKFLRGKHKPQFTPHVDTGDFVIVINAGKIKLTGAKLDQKQFRHHSGYPGGLRSLWYAKLLETHPERAIEKAVWGMLPKTSLGRRQLRKLKVYKGSDHPHEAQKPQPLPTDGGGAKAPAARPATPPAAEAEASVAPAAVEAETTEPQAPPEASADEAPATTGADDENKE